MIQTVLKSRRTVKPRVSFVLLDWGCRESFHSLDYLANQTVGRECYEIVWVEYYTRQAEGLQEKVVDYAKKGIQSPVDLWLIMGMPETVYYHKHLMYNVGIANSRGDIIIICDSDAMFTPRFVETVIECFDKDPNIVLHFDEVRNSRQDFYPFCYPDFELMTGEGAINWRDGKTTGLWDTEDKLHSLNYGACFCARRSDLIAIGGADEHMDYLGHVCGPYELTFRLVNKGLTEIWHEHEFLYHSWHPGQDGDVNYIGPSDGRHMSTTALEALETGRVMSLRENKAIRLERERGIQGAVTDQIDPTYLTAWTHEEVKKNPRFRMWKRSSASTKLLEENTYYNVLGYDDAFFAVLHSLGPINLASAADRERPGVFRAETLDEVKRLIEQEHGPEVSAPAPASGASAPNASDADVPVLLHQRLWYNIVAVGGEFIGLPHSVGPCDLACPTNRDLPGIVHGRSVADIDRLMTQSLGTVEEKAAEAPPIAAPPIAAPPVVMPVAAVRPVPVAVEPPPAKPVSSSQLPKLLDVLGVYNIVHYEGSFYAIPQTLGDINLADSKQRGRREILEASTRSEIDLKVRNLRLSILERALSAREQEIVRLQAELSERYSDIGYRDACIAARDTEITTRDGEIACRDAGIAERDVTIRCLEERLRAAEAAIVRNDSCYRDLPSLDVWERSENAARRSLFRSIGRGLLPALIGDHLYGGLKWRWLKWTMPALPSALAPVPLATYENYQIVAFQGRFFAIPAEVTESDRSHARLWSALGILTASTLPRLKRQIRRARSRIVAGGS